ncbi:hypothetical protein [Rhodoferax bucti]|uniref:hypothetical protein n=1 Tax=Rhodoferax bucti TaxID=2576305 RepID=UPI0011090BE9|nr:hypothetical protein [Rhodoferax bucti]
MMPRSLGSRVIAMVLTIFVIAQAQAQDRDPTAAPALAEGLTGGAGGGNGPLPAGSSVIVQSGKPYLVVGTRLYAVGQKVGNATLARITETEIWLQEGKHVTKVPRFAGIQRRVAQAEACAPARPASSPRRARSRAAQPPSTDRAVTTVAPCDGAQP